MGKTLATCTQ